MRMRFGAALCLLLVLPLVSVPPVAAAAKTVVKLASLVPEGSVWDKTLREMGDTWRRETEGRVELRIYPGGVAGDEPDMVRKMRIGQLHGAALTAVGLGELDDSLKMLQVPLWFDSWDELFHVLEIIGPRLEERLEAKGFVLLSWGFGGWVYTFSKAPIRSVEDLRSQKIFIWAGDDEMVQWWKARDFKVVPLAATDVLTGLQTGMIEGLRTTPLAALSLQWFRQVPYMHDLGLAPLVGGTVVTKKAWEKISEADRAALKAAARAAEVELRREIPRQDDQAVKEMQRRGLEVTTARDEEEWRKAAQSLADSSRGTVVPADIYDLALAARDAFRESQAAGGSR